MRAMVSLLVVPSSPHTWRCFRCGYYSTHSSRVFSTYVEVFPIDLDITLYPDSLLHVRGGVSILLSVQMERQRSSPRTWRCFYLRRIRSSCRRVFSTYVEVFLGVFPGMAGNRRLLHVRGGVSYLWRPGLELGQSSPRTWRCFRLRGVGAVAAVVFSTYVEVFPHRRDIMITFGRLLHVRGGVSEQTGEPVVENGSSPRTWRCFRI